MYKISLKTKKSVLVTLFLYFICINNVISQNSVSIGTEEINSNAVLQLVSPGNNQGFLVPQLNTSGRLAMNLPDSDNGMLVFDIELGKFFYWHNGAWNEINNGASAQTLTEVLSQNNSAGNYNITTLADPVNDQDAATKAYVDAIKARLEIIENTVQAGGIVTDCDGNVYNTVRIGNQIWMAENLKTTKYNDCTDIPLVTGNTAWSNLTTPGYCWYNNDSATFANPYGALYNWYTVETGNLCPIGWHVPSDAEWKILEMYLGMSQSEADSAWIYRGTDEGGKMKETDTTHWHSPNTGATNEIGFTALPGGTRLSSGSVYGVGNHGRWWSATENSGASAWRRKLFYDQAQVCRYWDDKSLGISVRCVRD